MGAISSCLKSSLCIFVGGRLPVNRGRRNTCSAQEVRCLCNASDRPHITRRTNKDSRCPPPCTIANLRNHNTQPPIPKLLQSFEANSPPRGSERQSFTAKFADLALKPASSTNVSMITPPATTLWRSIEFASAAFTGLVEGGVKLALTASQTRVTRSTLLLTAAIAVLFFMQCCTLLLLFSSGRTGRSGGVSIQGAGRLLGNDSDLSESGGMVEGMVSRCGAALQGVVAAVSGGGDVYWAGRLALLQQEVGLLASRIELVSGEIQSVTARLLNAAEPRTEL